MERYINVNDITLKGVAVFDENLDLLIPLSDVRKALQLAPTADVVPKSEIEMLQGALKAEERHNELTMEMAKKALANAKAEVARGIFEEIENEINNQIQNNYKVLPQFEVSNELWNRISGRINALQYICDFIAELKKKYTEV